MFLLQTAVDVESEGGDVRPPVQGVSVEFVELQSQPRALDRVGYVEVAQFVFPEFTKGMAFVDHVLAKNNWS